MCGIGMEGFDDFEEGLCANCDEPLEENGTNFVLIDRSGPEEREIPFCCGWCLYDLVNTVGTQ